MLDDKDLKILELLRKNSKLSTKDISKKLLIPITTVHNRIKKLEKNSVIKGYSVSLDHKKLGNLISAYIMITVNYTSLKFNKLTQKDLVKKLKIHPLVEEVSMVSGAFDLVVKSRTKTVEDLGEFVTKNLRSLPGVSRTQTMVILDESKLVKEVGI